MKTASIMLQSLCVPCGCHCRYCLLSWNGKTVGADYAESERYAGRFYKWIRENRPELTFNFAFGYAMEHPDLFRAIDFMRSIGSVGGEFLQFDGMRFRDDRELTELAEGLAEHGVKHLNFTFYGLAAYHDRFAGRQGDFAYMRRVITAARRYGIAVSAGIPLTHENAAQIDDLIRLLKQDGMERISLFVPHGEGRGALLEPIRFAKPDLAALGEEAKGRFRSDIYRTEAEWVTGKGFRTAERRALLISLTPDTIRRFEDMAFEDVIAYVEGLDEAYYDAIPPLEELAEKYGDPHGEKFFRQRDLYHFYQRRYIAEHGLRLYDVTDERQCGSRRY